VVIQARGDEIHPVILDLIDVVQAQEAEEDRPDQPELPKWSTERMDHYAESFCLLSGSCFRFVQENGTGHAQHCPYLIEWRGRFKDNAGKWHTVEACHGHRADLDAVQRT
jgi:hypothetical protein